MASTDYDKLVDSPREALTAAIRYHMNAETLDKVLKLPKGQRFDALDNLMKNAVRRAGIVSFNGIPHVWVRKWGIYIEFDYSALKIAVYDAMRKEGVPDGCYSAIERCVKLCWAETQSNRKDLDTTVVVMENGVFDTMDMQLHDFSPNYMTNMRVPYRYNPNEKPVNWMTFLNRVLPDLDLQLLLQEFLAATYVDRRFAKIEQMMILLGSGSNGKSVVFEVVSALLGDDNVSNFSISDLISGGRRDQNVAICNGKRLNYCSEIQTSEIGQKNADAFKALVSGEAMMARSLYKEPFRASSIPLLMANANGMPRVDDATYALQRRIIVMPFDVFIPEDEQDKELAATLKQELSGIFNWVMDGLARLRENKYQLTIPLRIKEYVNEYIRENNVVLRWMEDVGVIPHWRKSGDPVESWSLTTELYASFERWRAEHGEQPKPRKAFYEALDMQGFRRSRRRNGMGYEYFKLPSDEEIMKVNMDLAIAMEKRNALEAMKKKVAETGVLQIDSVSDLESYLGLPPNSVWAHMQNGILAGCYSRLPNGKKIYDVRAVQMALARSGFYQGLSRDNTLSKQSYNALRGLRKTFNAQMKMMGVPIRKHGNVNGYVPVADRDCWLVPDDWEYTSKAAEIVMSRDKNEFINNND